MISAALSIVAAIGMFVIVGINPAPAHATVYWGCPAGQGCLSTDFDGGGSRYTIRFSGPEGGANVCHNLPGYMNDAVSSVSSDFGSGYSLKIYQDANCNPWTGWVDIENLESTNYEWFYSGYNDGASSYKIAF